MLTEQSPNGSHRPALPSPPPFQCSLHGSLTWLCSKIQVTSHLRSKFPSAFASLLEYKVKSVRLAHLAPLILPLLLFLKHLEHSPAARPSHFLFSLPRSLPFIQPALLQPRPPKTYAHSLRRVLSPPPCLFFHS